jgi:hypothetical protein
MSARHSRVIISSALTEFMEVTVSMQLISIFAIACLAFKVSTVNWMLTSVHPRLATRLTPGRHAPSHLHTAALQLISTSVHAQLVSTVKLVQALQVTATLILTSV